MLWKAALLALPPTWLINALLFPAGSAGLAILPWLAMTGLIYWRMRVRYTT